MGLLEPRIYQVGEKSLSHRQRSLVPDTRVRTEAFSKTAPGGPVEGARRPLISPFPHGSFSVLGVKDLYSSRLPSSFFTFPRASMSKSWS